MTVSIVSTNTMITSACQWLILPFNFKLRTQNSWHMDYMLCSYLTPTPIPIEHNSTNILFETNIDLGLGKKIAVLCKPNWNGISAMVKNEYTCVHGFTCVCVSDIVQSHLYILHEPVLHVMVLGSLSCASHDLINHQIVWSLGCLTHEYSDRNKCIRREKVSVMRITIKWYANSMSHKCSKFQSPESWVKTDY